MNRFIYCFFSLFLFLFSCKKEVTLFNQLSPTETGIAFTNQLLETEQSNILTYEYFYNGGGVAVGDLNNDGLVDLFFTGNQVDNKLYLNKGLLKFEDISEQAGIGGRKGGWKTGVSLVDINADGWLDLYVCYSGPNPPEKRKNQLFINMTASAVGKQLKGRITFKEEAEAYGLADVGYATQAVFFDYDGDEDLDAFLVNHNLRGYQRQEAHVMREARDEHAGDKLFRNDNGVFIEVSQKAGIKSNPLGFGLGVVVADINADNRPDIYVANDYVEDDYLYENQSNGIFKDVLRNQVAHTSRFTMGLDIADVNNDALPDILTLDMLPEDNFRQKLLAFPDDWNNYQSMLYKGFWHQNMRNMLQINNGTGADGQATFSEIGQLAGVSNTDWSWAALLADFDNDGWKDLFVSNGELKDVTNTDFIKYAADEEMKKSVNQPNEALLAQIKKMPSSQTKNYIFKNKDGLQFENKQADWGFDKPALANGAVYADLDNDGDLEIITNPINDVVRIYKNNSREDAGHNDGAQSESKSNYLKIKLKGSGKNPAGVGAKLYVSIKELMQYLEFSPVRGFQSCIYDALHVGLGKSNQPLQVKVIWPDGKQQLLEGIKPNQMITLNYSEAKESPEKSPQVASWFEAADCAGQQEPIVFEHKENYSNDFTRQILLPYQYSYTGVRMAKGDINGDHLDDLYVGGARNQAGAIFIQQADGSFLRLPQPAFEADSTYEDKDAVFFDADQDQDLDLYLVSGDYGLLRNTPQQQDRLYLNDGKGHFEREKAALPEERINSSCVKVLDVDQDGDQDLFVGGTVIPGFFPIAEPSFLLLNTSKGLSGANADLPPKFIMSAIFTFGLVTDAVVTDLDKNGYPDLIVVGEWTSPTIIYNQKGQLQPGKALSTQESLLGWWNRIVADDLDNDGDVDLVIGNLGLNCQMKASVKEPITLDYADFDKNGTLDPIMSYFIHGISYPAAGRDEVLEQVVSLRKKFTDYASYSKATREDIFSEEQLKAAEHLRIDFTETVVLENTGANFVVHHLPIQAQYSPVYAITTGDFNEDGKKDILLCGNNSSYRLRIGKMDANKGILLSGLGKCQFQYIPQAQSGFHLQGDVKDIQQINDKTLVFFTNDGPVKAYKKAKKIFLPQ